MLMAKKIVEEIKKAVTKKPKAEKVIEPVTCTLCDGRGLENDQTICHVCHGNGVVS